MYERTYMSRGFPAGTLAMRLNCLERVQNTFSAFIGSLNDWSRKNDLPVEKGTAGMEAEPSFPLRNGKSPRRRALDPHPVPPLPHRARRSPPIVRTQDATPFDTIRFNPIRLTLFAFFSVDALGVKD